jgi:hypothetical protein
VGTSDVPPDEKAPPVEPPISVLNTWQPVDKLRGTAFQAVELLENRIGRMPMPPFFNRLLEPETMNEVALRDVQAAGRSGVSNGPLRRILPGELAEALV